MSFEVILPFLQPIEHLILDDSVSEVMVNASGNIFIERDGVLQQKAELSIDKKYLEIAVRNIARLLDDDISDEKPILDARLPDGSRVAAVVPPCSLGGTTLTIRKFNSRLFTTDDLVSLGTMPQAVAALLVEAVKERKNILVSGGAGSGKTTLLNALARRIPDDERIIVIEDTAEIRLDKKNLVRFEARRERGNIPPVTIRDLVKASLRHRPDRLLVGEVRGGEAFDLLQALNTGHSGSLSTLHANTAKSSLSRFVNCVLMSGVELPYAAIRATLADSLDLLVRLERMQGKRIVTEVLSIDGFDVSRDEFLLSALYSRETARGGN